MKLKPIANNIPNRIGYATTKATAKNPFDTPLSMLIKPSMVHAAIATIANTNINLANVLSTFISLNTMFINIL